MPKDMHYHVSRPSTGRSTREETKKRAYDRQAINGLLEVWGENNVLMEANQTLKEKNEEVYLEAHKQRLRQIDLEQLAVDLAARCRTLQMDLASSQAANVDLQNKLSVSLGTITGLRNEKNEQNRAMQNLQEALDETKLALTELQDTHAQCQEREEQQVAQIQQTQQRYPP